MKNFGVIRDTFNNLLIEDIGKKDKPNAKYFKKYIKNLKENEILKKQFFIFESIENKFEENEFKANLFLQETINILSSFNKQDIIKENTKLVSLLSENKLVEDVSHLTEAISNLITLEKNSKNIDTIVESTYIIIEHIKNNKPKEKVDIIDVPNTMLSGIFVDKFNERYSELNENEQKLFKTLLESTDEDKINLYEKYTRDCIDLINIKLTESDIDTKESLLNVKDKLLNEKVSNDDVELNNKIIKLDILKNNLI